MRIKICVTDEIVSKNTFYMHRNTGVCVSVVRIAKQRRDGSKVAWKLHERSSHYIRLCVSISLCSVYLSGFQQNDKASVQVLKRHNSSMYNSSLYINCEAETREGSREKHQRQT